MSKKSADIEAQVLEEMRGVPVEYLPNLLQLVRLFRETVTLSQADESFRRGWQEVLRGETREASDLWSGIDAE